MAAPLYVVGTAAEATAVLRRLARGGWQTRQGFAITDPGWDVSAGKVVRYGRVPDVDTGALAVLAAARGAGVVCVCDPTSPAGLVLSADLGRIGPVGVDPAQEPAPKQRPAADLPVTDEQAALLTRLADGETIAAAAEAEFLSLRTANRRIAAARKALGVATTREAVLAFVKRRR
ncbi:MAG TPA: LuxR family transcriptional regulator [Candidatus Stackebrandtia excrementipullorum]|nr:LuxR family transcriptional regulator [Candidatus Stackebrandtia excrementipullorum]